MLKGSQDFYKNLYIDLILDRDMSEQNKTLIILYTILCFLFSFIFGLIGNVSFGMIIFRSILFTIGGGGIIFAIIKLIIPRLFDTEYITHKLSPKVEKFESLSIDDDEKTNSDETETDIRRQDIPAKKIDIVVDDASPFSPDGAQTNQQTNNMSDDVSDNISDTISNDSNSDNESAEHQNPFDGKDGGEKDVEKFDEFKSDYDESPAEPVHSLTRNFADSFKEDTVDINKFTVKGDKFAGAIEKTMKEYEKSPKKVGMAVASWLKNGDNSK